MIRVITKLLLKKILKFTLIQFIKRSVILVISVITELLKRNTLTFVVDHFMREKVSLMKTVTNF